MTAGKEEEVVYLLNPTSNHNCARLWEYKRQLYIFWILHQTTTCEGYNRRGICCISFESYIKPQPPRLAGFEDDSCISFESYIKPQPPRLAGFEDDVVYLLNPTSNHNHHYHRYDQLEVVYLLNPTSNHNPTAIVRGVSPLYIFWILHQTTTRVAPPNRQLCCISFESYIKPQLITAITEQIQVVYLLNPTSNHNKDAAAIFASSLYIFWILHQTTTYRFESTDFQHITITFSNKKWWVGYNFLCKSTKKTPIE